MRNPVIIFGASGTAIAALEIFNSNSILVFGFLDDNKKLHNTEINGVTVLGSTDDDGFLKLIGKKTEAFVAVDENAVRKSLVKMLMERRKKMPVNAIHQSAIIPESAELGHGNLINAGVVFGSNSKVGHHCIFNSGALIEHESILGDYVQVGAGSIINAGVKVGNGCFIGSGVTIVSGVTIGPMARIGAGSIVIENIEKNQTVFGNPAKPVV